MIINLYKHRGYIWRTALAEVRTRYAGAGLGALWNLLQPLSMILIFTAIFTRLMPGADVLGAPYPVYLCAGLLPWSAFGECINRGTFAFITNAVYLRKMPIPEQVFVAQTALATTIGLGVSFAALITVAAFLGHYPSWHWLLLPGPMLLLIGLGFGIGLVPGTLNAFIRDVGQAVPIIMQIWFWLTPVVYVKSKMSPALSAVITWNPAYPYIESIRTLFIDRAIPSPTLWLAMIAWTMAAGAIGYAVLRKLRPELRDVI